MESTVKVASFQVPKSAPPSRLVDIACLLMIGLGIGGLSMYLYMSKHPQDVIKAQPHAIIQLQSGSNAAEQAKPVIKPQVIHRQQT